MIVAAWTPHGAAQKLRLLHGLRRHALLRWPFAPADWLDLLVARVAARVTHDRTLRDILRTIGPMALAAIAILTVWPVCALETVATLAAKRAPALLEIAISELA